MASQTLQKKISVNRGSVTSKSRLKHKPRVEESSKAYGQ